MNNLKTAQFGNKHAPEQTLIDALSVIEGTKIAVVVFLDKDDYVCTSWSDGSLLKRLGMMDIAKIRMMETAEEE